MPLPLQKSKIDILLQERKEAQVFEEGKITIITHIYLINTGLDIS